MVKFEKLERTFAGLFFLFRMKINKKWIYWLEFVDNVEDNWDNLNKDEAKLAESLTAWIEDCEKGKENWEKFEQIVKQYDERNKPYMDKLMKGGE